MKYIKELREGENVIEHYLCKSRASMKSRNGKTYLSLKLQDKTGIVDAKVWDMNKDIQSFQENDFIKVDAFVTTFNNELQLNVKRIRRSREGEYDPADFIPSTDKNIDEMYTQLLAYIKTIQSPYIKKLLEEIFLRHPVISKDFKYHSAAKTMHHSFRGGLVEHTLSVLRFLLETASRKQFPIEIMRTYFRVSPLQHKSFFLPISRLPLIPSFISPFGVFCHSLLHLTPSRLDR